MNSGAKTAALHIASNVVGTKNSFDILLTGMGQTVYEAWAIANGVSTGSCGARRDEPAALCLWSDARLPEGGTDRRFVHLKVTAPP